MKRLGTFTKLLALPVFALLLVALPFSASLSKAAPKAKDSVAQHLKTFDELDFDVYSIRSGTDSRRAHADDILVTYPDGHQTKGLKSPTLMS